jgi:hypothetical protein
MIDQENLYYTIQRAVYEFNDENMRWQYTWITGNHEIVSACFEVSILSGGHATKINSIFAFAKHPYRYQIFNLIGIFDSKQFHLKASLGGLNKKYSYPSFGPNVLLQRQRIKTCRHTLRQM